MREPIVKRLSVHADHQPDKVAVITPAQSLTYSELYRLVRGYSEYLKANGVGRGDVVLLKAKQTIDYPIVYYAIHLAGGVVTSLEKTSTTSNIIAVAEQVGAKVIITDKAELEEQVSAICLKPGDVQQLAQEYYREDAPVSFPDLQDSADILFTTGTTGSSKGVELSHNALSATAENLIFGCGYRDDTVIVAPGPLNHANAIRKLFTTIYNGSTIYILDGMMNIKAFYTALDYPQGRIACCLPPAAIRTIFQLTQDKLGEYAEKIDFIESATSPLPEADKKRLCELLPKTRLYNNYGSSEAASVCMYNYNEYGDREGCIGKPTVNSRILIVDDNHRPIKSSKDNMGAIACAGGINMKGYVNDPVQTAEVLVDNIVYTNDIGYMDDEGFVYIAGRKGDVINVGGLKVAPTEVESVALGFEGIDDCICIAVDDAISGHSLKLLVVMAKGLAMDVKAIRAYLLKGLESYKVPKFYEQVDKVERTYNGKLNRKAYR